MIEKLLQFCEIYSKLYKDQKRVQKSRCIIDAIAIIVNNIYKVWDKKKIAETLLINIKKTFDYISRLKLV